MAATVRAVPARPLLLLLIGISLLLPGPWATPLRAQSTLGTILSLIHI